MEKITFVTPHNAAYLLHVKPETKTFRGEILEVIPAKLIKFEGGRYSTDDPEEIRLIRKTNAFRHGKVLEAGEVEEGQLTELPEQAEQATIRGAISTASISKEAGVQVVPKKKGLQLEESPTVTKCDFPGCDRVYTNDPHGQRQMRGHHMAHRKVEDRKKAQAQAYADKKKEERK